MRSKSILPIPVANANGGDGEKIMATIKNARERHNDEVTRSVSAILDDVRKRGDSALFDYTEKFDGVRLTPAKVRVSADYLNERAALISPDVRRAIRSVTRRIRRFHGEQGLVDFKMKTIDGELSQVIKPLNRVGVYIPGGHTAYPSTVLMNIIPAQLAKVKEIVAVMPPKDEIDPSVAFALTFLKITEVYRVGGAQAIGALAYGTKTIKPVDKIVGPGNSYVATAKRLVYGSVGIDSVAGPSEVVIVADKTAPPRLVALDLLAQAEHGSGDEIAVCIVEDKSTAQRIAEALEEEVEKSPVKDTLLKLPPHAVTIFVTSSRRESMALADTIAPEHLQIMTATASEDIKLVSNAAAIFLGVNTPTVLGDYFMGTNHVLPTGGAARYASPLGVESFQKRVLVTKASQRGIELASVHASILARSEGFVHHAMSVEERLTT
ncbi:MAG: histidinol dehydrogenase [Chitinispirillales bacterium]|jgi:histidinol dehydrogenase|nr:histidinol dehydrogenase [Chitinispirillales bacterium]